MAYLMKNKARYERVAQHVIRNMYLDEESVDGIEERIARKLAQLSETEEGSVERIEAYAKIAGDALLGVVGKGTSE